MCIPNIRGFLRKQTFALISLIIALFFVCACTVSNEVQAPERPQSKDACEAQGGEWGEVFGATRKNWCRLPTTDAGKPCTNSSQCESFCVTDANFPANANDAQIVGACYQNDSPLGCLSILDDERISIICID